MSYKVIVTGAMGRIGRHITPLLAMNGFDVHAVVRKLDDDTAPQHWKNIKLYNLNLSDFTETRNFLKSIKADLLLHLAWYTGHSDFWNSGINDECVNTSLHLFTEFLEAGGEHIIAAGSCAEYDWNGLNIAALKETDACLPASSYGKGKLKALEGLQKLGVDYTWLRLFHTFGEFEPENKLVASLCLNLIRGLPAPVSSGAQTRDFLHYQDIARAILLVAQNTHCNGVYNLASGVRVSIAEVAAMLGRISGRPDLIRLGGLPDRADDPLHLGADVQKLHGAIDITFPPLEQRLTETFDWWKTAPASKPPYQPVCLL